MFLKERQYENQIKKLTDELNLKNTILQSSEDMRMSESFSPIKRNNLTNPRSVIFASKYSKESVDPNEMNTRKLKRVTLEDVKLIGLKKKRKKERKT